MTGPGDGALVSRALEGDRDAYDDLVRRHWPPVFGTAFRLVGNPEDAEDLAQEAFVRAHRALEHYREDAPFGAWIRRIVVHLARDRFRAIGRRPASAPLPDDLSEPRERALDAELDGRELTCAVDAALRQLPPHLRTALVLRTLEGLAYHDVAEATGVTPATARTQVMKARRALWRLLAPLLGRSEP